MCGYNDIQYEANNRIGTIGKAVANVDMRIDQNGEILCRGPHVFKGILAIRKKPLKLSWTGGSIQVM